MNENLKKDKKVLIIIPFNDFQDMEYKNTRKEIRSAGVKSDVCSSSTGTARGKFGAEVKIDLLINDMKAGDYDAVIYIGGPGAVEYINSEDAHRLARETVENSKLLAAICMAPKILARAGVLKDKNATVWTSDTDKSGEKVLKENGAIYKRDDVVEDGKIITANGPEAATEFGKKIASILSE